MAVINSPVGSHGKKGQRNQTDLQTESVGGMAEQHNFLDCDVSSSKELCFQGCLHPSHPCYHVRGWTQRCLSLQATERSEISVAAAGKPRTIQGCSRACPRSPDADIVRADAVKYNFHTLLIILWHL